MTTNAAFAAIDAIKDAVLKLSTQQEEILVHVAEIKETITKQRNEALLDRISRIEQSLKEQHIKLDTLNSIDINPTIEAPRPAAVRVAGTKKKTAADKDENDTVEVKETDKDDPQQFGIITEYFKFLWIKHRPTLYAKGVYSEEELAKLCEDNKETFDKKKGNELTLQKSIAFKIWRSLDPKRKEIVQAMRNDHANAIAKRASKEAECDTAE